MIGCEMTLMFSLLSTLPVGGSFGVAVAIRGSTGQWIGALTVAAMEQRFKGSRREKLQRL
jgi:hypothetical protein